MAEGGHGLPRDGMRKALIAIDWSIPKTSLVDLEAFFIKDEKSK
jgi:hypothetical protein